MRLYTEILLIEYDKDPDNSDWDVNKNRSAGLRVFDSLNEFADRQALDNDGEYDHCIGDGQNDIPMAARWQR